MRRALLVLMVLVGVLVIPGVAQAADVDQTLCESWTTGVWTDATSTCTVDVLDVAAGPDLITIGANITLAITGSSSPFDTLETVEVGANGVLNVDLAPSSVIAVGTLDNAGTVTIGPDAEIFAFQPFTNSGTIQGAGGFVGVRGTNTGSIDIGGRYNQGSRVVNYGTIKAPLAQIWGLRSSDPTLDNFGEVEFGNLRFFPGNTILTGRIVNHCGSSFSATSIDRPNRVQDLTCSIVTTITPAPVSGEAPLDVEWTVTLENDGDEDLDQATVLLSPDGAPTWTVLTLLSAANVDSGDTGADGILGVGETWSWTVITSLTADVTVRAGSAAVTPGGDYLTGPDVPIPPGADRILDNEGTAQAAVTVTDTTPPVWTVPGPITVEAPDGATEAVVDYTATATDNVGVTAESCDPPSGSMFPVGITTVTCTASDAAGNQAQATFDVEVLAAQVTTTTSTTTTTVASTTTTVAPTTTVAATTDSTLPDTGPDGDQATLGVTGILLLLAGAGLVIGTTWQARRND